MNETQRRRCTQLRNRGWIIRTMWLMKLEISRRSRATMPWRLLLLKLGTFNFWSHGALNRKRRRLSSGSVSCVCVYTCSNLVLLLFFSRNFSRLRQITPFRKKKKKLVARTLRKRCRFPRLQQRGRLSTTHLNYISRTFENGRMLRRVFFFLCCNSLSPTVKAGRASSSSIIIVCPLL